MATANLRGICYKLGDLHAVRDLVGEGHSLEIVNELLERGVTTYSVLGSPISGAIKECVERSLEAVRLRAEDIDAVIFMTESFSELFAETAQCATDAFRDVRNRCFELFHELGIRKASISCTTYGGCTNLIQGLLLAHSIVQRDTGRNVLLVAAEKFPSTKSRLMKEAVSIAGDGVAACIVNGETSAGEHAFKIEHVGIAPYKNIQLGGDMAAMLLEMFRAMKGAAADCYEACGKEPEHFKWVVLGDYNRQTSMTYGKLLGFPPERTFLENVGKFGHVPFDPLINVQDLANAATLNASDPVLLFLCGPVSCGSVVLEAI